MLSTQAPSAERKLQERTGEDFSAGVHPYREAYWDPSYEPTEAMELWKNIKFED